VLLTIISKNPTMNRIVKVALSIRPLMVSNAGATIRENPPIAVILPIVLTETINEYLIADN